MGAIRRLRDGLRGRRVGLGLGLSLGLGLGLGPRGAVMWTIWGRAVGSVLVLMRAVMTTMLSACLAGLVLGLVLGLGLGLWGLAPLPASAQPSIISRSTTAAASHK